MSGTAHTPGPWFAHGRYIGTKNHKSAVGECRDVNGNWSDDAKSSADAKLIAAAPELLEALQDALALLERHYPNPAPNGQISKARAALSKATASQA